MLPKIKNLAQYHHVIVGMLRVVLWGLGRIYGSKGDGLFLESEGGAVMAAVQSLWPSMSRQYEQAAEEVHGGASLRQQREALA